MSDYIYDMLDKIDKLSVPDAKQFMRDVYETKFGIFNHISGQEKLKRPLASIALHFPESPVGVRNVGDLMEYYINMDVQKHAGMSMSEFLSLPRHLLRRAMSAVEKKFNQQMKVANQAVAETNKVMNNSK